MIVGIKRNAGKMENIGTIRNIGDNVNMGIIGKTE